MVEKMTIRQLCASVHDEAIHIYPKPCYIKEGADVPTVELTNYVRAFEGIMSLEVFALKHNCFGFIAEVDLPPEVIEALAANADKPE